VVKPVSRPLGDVGPCLELDALHADLSGLYHEAGIDRVRGGRVRSADVEERGGQQDVGAGGLVLDTGLVLVAGDRVRDAAGRAESPVEDAAVDDRLEGFAVGDVRGDAAVEQVEQAGAAGEGLGRHVLDGQPVRRKGAGRASLPGGVVAAAKRQDEAVDLRLILEVDAGLLRVDPRGRREGRKVDR
jgi:hypothetical protein